ncbi:MAG TPA: NTP transferase domain-containing protein, partial [Thermoleophilaceae bacterium]|nr:NTP transferase domain-containing protein [Thermoleophilaceae bacterium]
MEGYPRRVIGAVLAGGAGTRLGRGSKAAVPLAGRPLASYPADALAAVCERVVIVCKRAGELPPLP